MQFKSVHYHRKYHYTTQQGDKSKFFRVFLLMFVKGCQFWLDPHRGVVNGQFLSLYRSNVVVILCRASQEAVL